MVYNLQSGNNSANKFAVGGIEFCNFEVTVTGEKGFTIGTGAEFNVAVDHSFTQINLPRDFLKSCVNLQDGIE